MTKSTAETATATAGKAPGGDTRPTREAAGPGKGSPTALSVRGGRTFCPVDWLAPDLEQPRKTFDAVKLRELGESFGGRPEGIQEDLVVRKVPGAWLVDEVRSGGKVFYQVLDRNLIHRL